MQPDRSGAWFKRFALTGLPGNLRWLSDLCLGPKVNPWPPPKGAWNHGSKVGGSAGDQEDSRAAETVRGFIVRYGSSCFQNLDHDTPERILDRKDSAGL
jgi:hypothetical protein